MIDLLFNRTVYCVIEHCTVRCSTICNENKSWAHFKLDSSSVLIWPSNKLTAPVTLPNLYMFVNLLGLPHFNLATWNSLKYRHFCKNLEPFLMSHYTFYFTILSICKAGNCQLDSVKSLWGLPNPLLGVGGVESTMHIESTFYW